MKIITLWQPWASLIVLGYKKFETRSWGTDYRGKLCIHAAKRKIDKNELAAIYGNSGGELDFLFLEKIDYPLGQIIAVCELVSCSLMIESSHLHDARKQKDNNILISEVSTLERSVGIWEPGRYAWKLENVKQIEPISWVGKQGLTTLSSDITLENMS